MNYATMKRWSITSNQNGFIAPELITYRLQGDIYHDSRPEFPDGSPVITSPILSVNEISQQPISPWVPTGKYKLVKTAGATYLVFPEYVDPEYEKQFPGAYERLRVTEASE